MFGSELEGMSPLNEQWNGFEIELEEYFNTMIENVNTRQDPLTSTAKRLGNTATKFFKAFVVIFSNLEF